MEIGMRKQRPPLGNLLRTYRENHRLTADEMSDLIFSNAPNKNRKGPKTSQKIKNRGGLIRMWERGHALPSIMDLRFIAANLEIPLPDLWTAYRHSLALRAGLSIVEIEPENIPQSSLPKSSLIRIDWKNRTVKVDAAR